MKQNDTCAYGMVSIASPAVMLVVLVAVVGALVLFAKKGYPALQQWVTRQVTKRLPPDFPRPPQAAGPPSSEPRPSPPTDGPTSAPMCPPDGSGGCASDDKPVVAPVGLPPACSNVSSADFKAWARKQKWGYGAIPIIGPIWKSVDLINGAGDPMSKLLDQIQQSSTDLREATVQWQNSYFRFLGDLAKDLLPATESILDPHKGLIQLAADTAAMPLNHAAYMLVAPVLGLLVCSAILIWAI